MITPQVAIDIAKDYSTRKKLGWDESSVIVKKQMIKGDPCFVIYTGDIDLTKLDWLDTVTTNAFHVYVSMVTGECLGYEIGNRGICFEH
ncbi:hypothetical protein EF68_000916 [Salmonella enterica subsp. enterica]|uniref:hypothetical protein n=1 Tax=Salmonella enterica TaxID=28901 RepID=UPI00071AE95D|nr:hypothetical protein [Salmonella enterica]EAB9373898.1 hypothetical protein [Salmonella enterica subsp. enterica serovar Llandoff]EBS0652303.1 hypothetical protein [Salmonella enterica subsp. enterica serovar Yolo]EBX9172547.1 hypothetical protein [Salmonella enterica subsp. enterica serovar Kandla]EDS3307825.1 hypothetical protein [Salmonella enterica subsp. enterica serovar Umbadah]EDT2969071.1 hypothetical protein [Salmonella enterica subsp. enterica serovar Fischerstrasse]EDX9403040.1 